MSSKIKKTKPRRRASVFVHSKQTGKLLHHRHTSFAILVAILLLAFFSFTVFFLSVRHKSNVLSSTIELQGVVTASPPTLSPTITAPVGGQHFTNKIVDAKGTCEEDRIVEVFLNGIFAGSTVCENGLFNIAVSLFSGSNIVTARLRDNLGQTGPESSIVSIFYDLPSGANQDRINDLFIRVDSYYRGIFPGMTLKTEPEIVGGKGPYQLVIDWQDGESFQITVPNHGKVSATHVYDKPGVYKIRYSVKDGQGTEYSLFSLVVVNGVVVGSPESSSGVTEITQNLNAINTPIFIILSIASIIVISFWLGEHLAYRKALRKHYGKNIRLVDNFRTH